MSIPLLLNITGAIAFLASFLFPMKWILALWVYCFVVYKIVEYTYPEYWAGILSSLH